MWSGYELTSARVTGPKDSPTTSPTGQVTRPYEGLLRTVAERTTHLIASKAFQSPRRPSWDLRRNAYEIPSSHHRGNGYQGTSPYVTELASVEDLAYPYTGDEILPPSDLTMRSTLPYDSKTWTLDQIVEYGKTAAYSGLQTVAQDAPDWLYNNLYRSNVNGMNWNDGPYAYVVSSDQRDPYAAYDLLKIFDFGKVEMRRATRPFRAGGERYPEGSIIIEVQQPLGRWVDQLLRIDEYPDNARKCGECPLIMPYSETTDNIALFMGVDAEPIANRFRARTVAVDGIEPADQTMPADPGADGVYAVGPESYGLGKFISGRPRRSSSWPIARRSG